MSASVGSVVEHIINSSGELSSNDFKLGVGLGKEFGCE